MTLIKSISGIRGTIGGATGDSLNPIDIVKFTYAYCNILRTRKSRPKGERLRIVVGRDARLSGEMVEQIVCGTLISCGVDVVKAGLASTPTIEMAVTFEKADGGIILTASHNPKQWNALKLLNERGEFLNAEECAEIFECADNGDFSFADIDGIGRIETRDYVSMHINAVLALEAVDAEAVRRAGFKVVLDAVNSVGGIIIPRLLERLGVECIDINCEPTGDFAHEPEPLPKNLTELSDAVKTNHADLGISVDPDVDRLVFYCEDGTPFGEEYTLVSVADYLLSKAIGGDKPIVAVSNLCSSRALKDVAEKYGGEYFAAAVGEVNVTTKMREVNALIGGEGNGGVIYPALHYGRDAVVGLALFLTNLASKRCKVSGLRMTYPDYQITKERIELSDKALIDNVLSEVRNMWADEDVNEIDGVKVSFEAERKWVHLRRSNTEPIIRIYAEAPTKEGAEALAAEVISVAKKVMGK